MIAIVIVKQTKKHSYGTARLIDRGWPGFPNNYFAKYLSRGSKLLGWSKFLRIYGTFAETTLADNAMPHSDYIKGPGTTCSDLQ